MKTTLKKGWYLISDQDLFLFAANGFWDREERMVVYRRVKERYVGKSISNAIAKEE
jgi:hypothetical protein